MHDSVLPNTVEFSRAIVDLCTAVAGADGIVSNPEIGLVLASLRKRFGIIADGDLYAYLQERIERPCSTLRALSGLAPFLETHPDSAVIIAALIADLVRKDGVTPEEVTVFRLVANGLSLEAKATEALAWTLKGVEERAASHAQKVWDLSAPSGLTAELGSGALWAFPLDNGFLLFAESIDSPLFLDGQEIASGETSIATRKSVLHSGLHRVSFDQLARVVEQQEPATKSWKLAEAGGGYRFHPVPNDEEAACRITLVRGAFELRMESKIDPARVIGSGWTALPDIPDTERRVFSGKIDSRFLGPGAGFDVMELWSPLGQLNMHAEPNSEKKSTVVLSDLPGTGDIIVDSGLDLSERGSLLVEIRRTCVAENWSFTISPVRLPAPALLNHVPLMEGRLHEFAENGHLVIGNTSLDLDARTGAIAQRAIVIEHLDVDHLGFKFKDGKSGTEDMTFSVGSGQMVAIMGPSGSGKSTLLKLLLGILKPTTGTVRVNGQDFYEHYDDIRSRIGYVPQDDLLYDNLTVYENMLFAARLRLPSASRRDIEMRIEQALQAVNLTDRKHMRVGDVVKSVLSGGQRKRLNIAQELIVKPDLFFLDEPTSGLSSRDSQMIIGNLKQLSEAGTIVFVVIHQPSSVLYRSFDQVAILDVGGRLSFFGPPVESVRYFHEQGGDAGEPVCGHCGHLEPERIFSVMERSTTTGQRWMRPEEWKQLFSLQRVVKRETPPPETGENMPRLGGSRSGVTPAARVRRTAALIGRNLLERVKDPVQAVLTFAAPIVLGVAMAFLMRQGGEPYLYERNPDIGNYFFLSVIIFILLGLMASIGEVIKDRPKLVRERLLDIRPIAYLTAKTMPFLLFNIVQVITYEIAGFLILRFPFNAPAGLASAGMSFAVYFFLLAVVCSWAAFALGLLVSTLLKTQAAAFAIIPLILIPQILFGGLFIDFSTMARMDHEEVPWYANAMFSRWAYEALASGQGVLNPSYRLTDSDFFRKWQERTGIGGTKASITDPVIARLQADQPNDPPTRISASVYETLAAASGARKQTLESMYGLNDKQTIYILKSLPTEAQRTAFKEIAASVSPHGFINGYTLLMPNDSLTTRFFADSAWLDKVSLAPTMWKPIDLLPSINRYPANRKEFGPFVVWTVTYNALVLLLQGLACTLAFLLVFRRMQGKPSRG